MWIVNTYKKKYITVKEYCEITGLHRNTVYKLLKANRLDILPRQGKEKYLISTQEIPSYNRLQKESNG